MGIKLLKPALSYKIWGGHRLSQMKHLPEFKNQNPLGETWEISNHPEGKSYFVENGNEINFTENEMPYLVKLIDTSDVLSVQVHPGDVYARLHEKSQGKTECWLVLDAAPGAGIYLGFRPGVSRQEFELAIKDKNDLSPFLNFYAVKPGDFFYVPAGSVHAIGKDVFLAEIQQSSGITYRVWDWNRVEKDGRPRELHIAKSLDVLNFESDKNTSDYFQYQRELFTNQKYINLVSHPQFEVILVNLHQDEEVEIHLSSKKRVKSFLNLVGKKNINQCEVVSFQAGVLENQHLKIKAQESGSLLIIY